MNQTLTPADVCDALVQEARVSRRKAQRAVTRALNELKAINPDLVGNPRDHDPLSFEVASALWSRSQRYV